MQVAGVSFSFVLQQLTLNTLAFSYFQIIAMTFANRLLFLLLFEFFVVIFLQFLTHSLLWYDNALIIVLQPM